MPTIEETLTLMGFAWIDEEGSINWAMREDFEGVKPSDRPEGCTPVVIEIVPTEEWSNRSQKNHEFLGDISEKINQFHADLSALQRVLKVKGEA